MTKLLRVLRKEKVGLHEMEVVVTKQLKARKVGGGTFKRRGELLEILFTEKLDDSMRQEVKRRRRRALDRIKLEGMLGGPKSRRSRTSIKNLKRKVDQYRQECKTKNKEKVDHLKSTYSDRIEKEKSVDLPKHLQRYSSVKVFKQGCELVCEELKGPVVIEREGFPITLTQGEKDILTLGPKFCVYEKCNEEKFVTNVEISFLKYKWDRMSDADKEPYRIAGREKLEGDSQTGPEQDQGPAEKSENTAKREDDE